MNIQFMEKTRFLKGIRVVGDVKSQGTFTFSIERDDVNWKSLLRKQQCRYSCKRCFKVRKSQANVSIGTCTVRYGTEMTAKTILVQLHHKIDTFEAINKHLVLVVQDHLLDYMKREFAFGHVNSQALIGDSMHFHSYKLKKDGVDYKLVFDSHCSTDSSGISALLGLKAEANIGFEEIAKIIEARISDKTVFTIA